MIDLSQYNTETELLKAYNRMAKSADQKLRRLEKLAEQPYYKNATRWAYAEAMQDLKKWSPNKIRPRFQTAPPRNKDGSINKTLIKEKMRDIETFMEKPTSTKAGIKKSYENRASTINQKYNTNFSWTEMSTFYNSKIWEKAASSFGSDTAMKIFATIGNKKDDVMTLINTANKRHMTVGKLAKQIQSNPDAYSIDISIISKNLDPAVYDFISKNKSLIKKMYNN